MTLETDGTIDGKTAIDRLPNFGGTLYDVYRDEMDAELPAPVLDVAKKKASKLQKKMTSNHWDFPTALTTL
jgi:hypothetical protein